MRGDKKKEMLEEALDRAKNGESLYNYETIYEGFEEKGISPDDVKPRENVFTYNAWLRLGRGVKKGEHGVKVVTWVPREDEKGQKHMVPRTATVFHVTQTEAVGQLVTA